MEIKAKIGLNPCGAYDGTREYSFLDTTEAISGTYVSLKDNNKGHEVTDTSWWECIIDLTGVNKAKDDANTAASNADNKAALANTAIENANTATDSANTAASNADSATAKADTAADNANEKAEYASTQGTRAKGYADHPNMIGNDNYWYVWDEASSSYKKTDKYTVGGFLLDMNLEPTTGKLTCNYSETIGDFDFNAQSGKLTYTY